MNPNLGIFTQVLADFRNTLFTLFTANGTLFQTAGMHIFTAVATIMIVLAGVRIAFGGDYRKFAVLIALIACCHVMVADYGSSIPFFGGQTFFQIIPNWSFYLADQIGAQGNEQLTSTLQDILTGMNQGSPLKYLFGGVDLVLYLIVVTLISALELAMFVVIAYGYLALGVTILFGPILIPWILVPKLDFLFWGWFKSLIKFSFYPTIANAVLFLVSKLLLAVLSVGGYTTSAGGYTTAWLVPSLPIFIIVFAAGIYACFKVPGLVNDLFAGAAASGAANAMESAARMAVVGAIAG